MTTAHRKREKETETSIDEKKEEVIIACQVLVQTYSARGEEKKILKEFSCHIVCRIALLSIRIVLCMRFLFFLFSPLVCLLGHFGLSFNSWYHIIFPLLFRLCTFFFLLLLLFIVIVKYLVFSRSFLFVSSNLLQKNFLLRWYVHTST